MDRSRSVSVGDAVATPASDADRMLVSIGPDRSHGRNVESALGEIADRLADARRAWAVSCDRAELRRELHQLLCLLDDQP